MNYSELNAISSFHASIAGLARLFPALLSTPFSLLHPPVRSLQVIEQPTLGNLLSEPQANHR